MCHVKTEKPLSVAQSLQQDSGGKADSDFSQGPGEDVKHADGSFWRSCPVAPVFRLPVQDNAVVQ